MDYELIKQVLSYLIVGSFLFVLILSKEHRALAAIVFLSASYSMLSGEPLENLNREDYILRLGWAAKLEGITALAIIMLGKGKGKTKQSINVAINQAALLSFATICHSMILLDLLSPSNLTLPFYSFYDEAIILICIAQLIAIKGGIIESLSNARDIIRICNIYTGAYRYLW